MPQHSPNRCNKAVDVRFRHAWVVRQIEHGFIKVAAVSKPLHVVGSGVKAGPPQAPDKLGSPRAAHRNGIE